MYKIDTIFYFCNTAAEYDMENVPEGTDQEPAGIDPRTIVFIADTGEIRKAGILYGGIEDETLINKIKTVISNHPDSLPVAASDSLGAIKVGDSFTMTDSDVIGSKDKLEIKWDYLLSKLKNYTSETGERLYDDQWIRTQFNNLIHSQNAQAITDADVRQDAAISALRTDVDKLDTIYATDQDLLDKINTLKALLQDVDNGIVSDINTLITNVAAEHTKNEQQDSKIANIDEKLDRISTGEDGVNLQTINSRLSEVERINSAQATSITTNRSDIDHLVNRLNEDVANLATLATRVGVNETDITSLRTLYENLNSWLASDSELQEKLDALKTMLQNVDTGMLTRLTDLETAWNRLDAAVSERLKSADYETEMAAIRSALETMISAGELASLEATLRQLINNNKLDADTKISSINSTLSQITEAWVIRTISSLFTDWEFVKSLDTDHIPMTWEPRLQEFIQVVVNNMSDDENSAIWSMFEQKYNELLTKIEGITVLTDGEGAISIDQLVAIIKSYIDTANFESVNEMKTFWAHLKSAFEDKDINTNDELWLQKLEEILKNYETYEWVVAGFESRSGEEMNLAQQFAQAQAKNTEHDTAIYQHGQRLTDDEARLAQAEGDIDALELRATTIETNLNAESSARTSAVTDLQNRVSSAESSIGSHTSAIETINTTISTLDGKVTANETNIATLTSDAGLTSDAVSDLKSRMTTAENNLSAKANASNVYTKAEVDGIKEELQENIDGEATLRQNVATDLANYKTTVNTNLNSKANASDVYTKTEIDGKVTTINNSISGEAELRQAVENDLANYKTTVTQNLGAKANVNDVYSKTDIDGKVSTINTNVTAASNLAQEAKNDFSNWKNDETDGYKAFTTSTSNALTSKASVSYVDGIKDDLQTQINNIDVESGVTTSADVQGWLDDGTLTLDGITAATMYSRLSDAESSISTKAESTTVTDLAGEVSSIQSTQSTMSSRIGEVESSVSTAVKKDSNGKITSDIILDSDHVTITAAVIEASGASLSAESLHTTNTDGSHIDIEDYTINVAKDSDEFIHISPYAINVRNLSSSGTERYMMLKPDSCYLFHDTGSYSDSVQIKSDGITFYEHYPSNNYSAGISLVIGGLYISASSALNMCISSSDATTINIGRSDTTTNIAGTTTLGNVNITGSITTQLGGNTMPSALLYIGLKDKDDTIRYLVFNQGILIGHTTVQNDAVKCLNGDASGISTVTNVA